MNYFNGYYATSNNAVTIAATPDATYIPNWVHIFNAHVLPKKSGGSTPHANTMPASSTDSNGIRIVIANPQARCQTIFLISKLKNRPKKKKLVFNLNQNFFKIWDRSFD